MAKKDKDTVWCTMHDEPAEQCQPKGHGPSQLPSKWQKKGK